MEYQQYNKLIDGKCVWDLHGTHGFPLELSLELLWEKQIIPTWDRLLEAARRDGANIDRLREKIVLYSEHIYPNEIAQYIKVKIYEI